MIISDVEAIFSNTFTRGDRSWRALTFNVQVTFDQQAELTDNITPIVSGELRDQDNNMVEIFVADSKRIANRDAARPMTNGTFRIFTVVQTDLTSKPGPGKYPTFARITVSMQNSSFRQSVDFDFKLNRMTPSS